MTQSVESSICTPTSVASGARDLVHAAGHLAHLLRFLDAASHHLNHKTRPWPGTGYAKASHEPQILARFGRFVSALRAGEALLGEARVAFELDDPDAARLALAAHHQMVAVGRDFISSTIELLGASVASEKLGFDVYWRSFVRDVQAHEPAPIVIGTCNAIAPQDTILM